MSISPVGLIGISQLLEQTKHEVFYFCWVERQTESVKKSKERKREREKERERGRERDREKERKREGGRKRTRDYVAKWSIFSGAVLNSRLADKIDSVIGCCSWKRSKISRRDESRRPQ